TPGPPCSASRSATANPSVSGSTMSRSTSSGRNSSTAVRADAPSAASPTTANPPASSSRRAKPRKPAWSSTISTVCGTYGSSHARPDRSIGEIPNLEPGSGISSMRPGRTRLTVDAMNDGRLLRLGAVAALAGAVAQLVASALEPDWGGDPGKAVRVVAASGFWNGDRLLDLIGVFMAVAALTIVGRTFPAGAGREWSRAGQ